MALLKSSAVRAAVRKELGRNAKISGGAWWSKDGSRYFRMGKSPGYNCGGKIKLNPSIRARSSGSVRNKISSKEITGRHGYGYDRGRK